MLKHILQTVFIAGALIALSACATTVNWQEEVRLLDGRVIVVTQKRRYEPVNNGDAHGDILRETWATFKLYQFGPQEIVWHQNLDIQVLNVYEGDLYLIGMPISEREFRQYGSPNPSYVAYIYNKGEWDLLPFNKIPAQIYESNMWIGSRPGKDSAYITLAEKAIDIKRAWYPNAFKRVDPTFSLINY